MTPKLTPTSLAFLLIALICAMAGCERQPTAVAIFEMTVSPEGLTLEGEPDLEKSLIAAIKRAEYDIKSRNSIEEVMRDLGLTKGFPRHADGELTNEAFARYHALVDSLLAKTTVKIETRTDGIRLVRVSTNLEDREHAAQFVNRLVENYIRHARTTISDILLKELHALRFQVPLLKERVNHLTMAIASTKPLTASPNPSIGTETEEDRLRARVRELEERWEKVKDDVQFKREELHETEKKLAIAEARMLKLQMELAKSQGYGYLKLRFIERAPSR